MTTFEELQKQIDRQITILRGNSAGRTKAGRAQATATIQNLRKQQIALTTSSPAPVMPTPSEITTQRVPDVDPLISSPQLPPETQITATATQENTLGIPPLALVAGAIILGLVLLK